MAEREIDWRVPRANRSALELPPGLSIFEATEGGLPVDAAVYNTRTGRVLIGRSTTHQGLISRFAPEMSLDDCVRADLFERPSRVEFDTYRAVSIELAAGWP